MTDQPGNQINLEDIENMRALDHIFDSSEDPEVQEATYEEQARFFMRNLAEVLELMEAGIRARDADIPGEDR